MPRPDFERERATGRLFAKAWQAMRERGLPPIVISRSEHPEAWLRWRNYYKIEGLSMMLAMMDDKGVKTVPCLNPDDMAPLATVQPSARTG